MNRPHASGRRRKTMPSGHDRTTFTLEVNSALGTSPGDPVRKTSPAEAPGDEDSNRRSMSESTAWTRTISVEPAGSVAHCCPALAQSAPRNHWQCPQRPHFPGPLWRPMYELAEATTTSIHCSRCRARATRPSRSSFCPLKKPKTYTNPPRQRCRNYQSIAVPRVKHWASEAESCPFSGHELSTPMCTGKRNRTSGISCPDTHGRRILHTTMSRPGTTVLFLRQHAGTCLEAAVLPRSR